MKERVKQLCADIGLDRDIDRHRPDIARLYAADIIAQAIIEHSRSIEELSKVIKAKYFYKR